MFSFVIPYLLNRCKTKKSLDTGKPATGYSRLESRDTRCEVMREIIFFVVKFFFLGSVCVSSYFMFR